MPQSDPEALRAFFRAPDESTFAPVYEASKGLVYTLCRRILREEADALDAFQSVYVRLLELARATSARPPRGDPGELERLLPRLALREAGNLKKRRQRRAERERPLGTLIDGVAAADGGAAKPLSERQLRRELERLVDALPEKLRLPVQLHYFHGLPRREVALALAVSSSTVSYRVRLALRRLERASRRAGLGPVASLLAVTAGSAALWSPREVAAATVFAEAAARGGAGGGATLHPGVPTALKSAAFVSAGFLVLAVAVFSLWQRGGEGPEAGGAPPVAQSNAPAEGAAAAPLARAADPAAAPAAAAPVAAAPADAPPAEEAPGYAIEGQVRDAETGAPVEGAVVSGLPWNEDLVTESGAQGTYRFELREPLDLQLTCRAVGYVEKPAVIHVKGPGIHYLDFALESGTTFSVSVVDRSGAPIAGAKIHPSDSGCRGCYRGDIFVETDAEGRAVLDDVSPRQPPNLQVEKAGFKTVFIDQPRTVAGALEGRAVLEPIDSFRYVIAGAVRGPGGHPIEGATIEYKDGHGTRYASDAVYGEHKAVTDAAGQYRLEFEDDYESCHLGVGAPGWAPVVRQGVHARPDGEPVVLDFELEPAHWLEGVVVDEAGAPLAGVGVSSMPRIDILNEGIAYPVVYRSTMTDGEGRFRLDDLSGPTVAVRLRRPRGSDFPSRDLDAVEVDREVRFVLRRWGVIRGHVVDAASGEPVTEFNVKLHGSLPVDRVYTGEAFSNPEGAFTLEHLEKDQTYGVIVAGEGFLETRVDDVPALAPGSQETLRVELGRGRELQGFVVDAVTGAPVANARVTYGVFPHGELSWMLVEATHALENFQREFTGDEGHFSFLEGSPGTLFFEAPGYTRRLVEPADRGAHTVGARTLHIPLSPGVRVAGRVGLEENPTGQVQVVLLKSATAISAPVSPPGDELLRTRADAAGSFFFDGVPPASYAVEVVRFGAGNYPRVTRRYLHDVTADGVEGLVLGADLGKLTFRGTLREPDGSTPVSATLRLRPRFESSCTEIRAHVSSFSEKEPVFSMTALRPGTYDAEVIVPRAGQWQVLPLEEVRLNGDLERDLVVPPPGE